MNIINIDGKPPKEQVILKLLASSPTKQEGFIALMELYREPLYWHVRRMVVSHEDAQDVLQEALIKAYRYIDNFKGNSSLKTWLYKVATNEAIRHLQRRQVETRSYDDHQRLLELFEGEREVDFSTVEAKLQMAILTLSPKQRLVFNLRYYDELSYEQIAEVTESNVAALKSNYHYAIIKIKEYMLNQMED